MSHPINPAYLAAGKQAADQMMDAAFGRTTPPRTPDRTTAGYCPMGCGTTLFVGAGGHITCSLIGCPRPTAVDEILAERETEHIVTLLPHDFSILHPLRERLDQELLRCDLHAYLIGLDGPPRQPGRYCARKAIDDTWTWERLDAAAPSAGES